MLFLLCVNKIDVAIDHDINILNCLDIVFADAHLQLVISKGMSSFNDYYSAADGSK